MDGAVIRTPDQRLRVFVSSTLAELSEERATVRAAIERLQLTPVMFELGARPHPPRELYRAYLEQSQVFVGIYWQRYGWVAPGETRSGLEDEYVLSAGLPRLLYVKSPAPDREPRLGELLRRIQEEDTASYKPFRTTDELGRLVASDLALLLSERFTMERGPTGQVTSLAPGLPAEFPPLRTDGGRRHNLPAQLSSFVGREGELANVKRALDSSRLVTLTGAGGSGKSRLALQAAADLVDVFPDGTRLVELASVTDPDRIAATVATGLGIIEDPRRPLVETLTEYVRSRSLLVVLDNCEHLLPACSELTQTLLQAAAGLRVLATSQEALSVPGETILPVAPLPVPPQDTDASELVAFPAVRLFVERARAVRPGFAVTPANAAAVTHVVRSLDGIPLALELAAARVKMLSAEQIDAHLSDRFRLLGSGTRTAPPRQQTLRSAMDWSYDLLSGGERTLLRRLSAFQGGWTVEAATAVSDGDSADALDVLDLIGRLVDKSLVFVMGGQGRSRYGLLETVRQYGWERLVEAGESASTRDAHRAWCLSVVEAAADHVYGSDHQASWVGLMEEEHDNLQAALEWSVARGDAAASLRMAAGSAWFWYLHGHWDTARRWLEQSLALTGAEPALRGQASAWAAVFAWRRGDLGGAQQHAEECLAELAGSGDRAEGLGLLVLALVGISRRRPDQAQDLGRRALTVFRARQDAWGLTTSMLVLAHVAMNEDSAEVAGLLDESAALLSSGNDVWGRAHVLDLQGNQALRALDLDLAEELHRASHALARELGDRERQAESLLAIGHVHLLRGELDEAAATLEESRSLMEQLKESHSLAHVAQALALLAVSRGREEEGAALLADISSRLVDMGLARMGGAYAAGLADVYRRAGRPVQASLLLRHALSLIDEQVDPAEHLRARQQLTQLEESADNPLPGGRDTAPHLASPVSPYVPAEETMAEPTRDIPVDGDLFSQQVDGLVDAAPTPDVSLSDGDELELRIGPVRKQIAGTWVRMLSYNGSIPGPLLRVRQGTGVTVGVVNETDLEQTVHWHGLRLDNRFDGVPYLTQDPIPVGGRFTCRLTFPDPGLYWYHPHIREDYGQEMGLYGQIVVEPADPGYWPPVNREVALTLDDVLLENGRMAAFHRSGPTHTMMGRFGTVMLVGGETEPTFDVTLGEVVRLYLTNTANTRIFNVAMAGTGLKLVGGDSGRYEHEELVDSLVIAPSERAVVDVLFEAPGGTVLENRTPQGASTLATFAVSAGSPASSFVDAYRDLRTDPALTAARAGLVAHLDRVPDKSLRFAGTMDMSGMDMGDMDMGDMDTGDMDMGDMDTGEAASHGAAMTGHHGAGHGNEMGSDTNVEGSDGIEWEDSMAEMNVMSNRSNMVWEVIDTATGASNQEISWQFRVGDRVKIRLDNSAGSDHDMHHPFHIHGAGRFLVLDRGGEPERNLVWKDTVLVRAGEVVHLLLDVDNPGRWMAHCHIAEHNESGMMFSFDVLDEGGEREATP